MRVSSVRAAVALLLVCILALVRAVPAAAALPAGGEDDAARVRALIATPCLAGSGPAEIAQSTPVEPDHSTLAAPSPSPTGSVIPLPVVPGGPSVLQQPTIAPASPQPTPPPLPTPTPSTTASAAPIYITPVTPTPSPSPSAALTAGPIGTPAPIPTPYLVPKPGETLGPDDYAVLGDRLTGSRNPGAPWDLDGHVNILYQDGAIVGDHAHFDGTRYIDITGNTYLQNREGDTQLTADSIRFDTVSQRAILINGRGVTTQGVQSGRLHFTAKDLRTERNGVTHGNRASLTTCESPRSGYHAEAKTLDVFPGDKAVARHVVLYLGPLAILYLPLLVISLVRDPGIQRRQTGFIPVVGYSQAEGYYVKARLGFGTTQYYYGYYRIEYESKIGYGLGYVGTIARRDGRRSTDVDVFRQYNRTDRSSSYNANLNDTENLSRTLRATARFSYQGDYGPLIQLPANISTALALTHSTTKDTENVSYSRQSSGSAIVTSNYGVSSTYNFSPKITNALTATYTTNANNNGGVVSTNNNLHYNTDTHLIGGGLDYDLVLDRYLSQTPNGVQKEPELSVRPHGPLFPRMTGFPTTLVFTAGQYYDPIAALGTQRYQAQLNFGPGITRTALGDFNSTLSVIQDAYGTGDMKAQISQQVTLTSPIGNHFNNTLSYSNQHVNGLGDEPFSFDTIGGANKNLTEVFRVFNADVYALTLQTGTAFNRMAQPINYQLLTRPFNRVSLILGGNYAPGPGFGFDRTNVQFVAPLGNTADIQVSTFVDWKQKGRLESKNIYLRKIFGGCYEILAAYNQDLKTVNVTINLLAFPSQAVNFGLGQQTSIVPQSFATDQFFTGR